MSKISPAEFAAAATHSLYMRDDLIAAIELSAWKETSAAYEHRVREVKRHLGIIAKALGYELRAAEQPADLTMGR